MKLIHYLPGQTMTEMIVVLFIISVGLYGAVTLIFSNLVLQENDADMIKAMNLAREMLEIVQNKRDSNWLASKSFSDGMLNISGCVAVPNWNATDYPSFSSVPNIDDPLAVVKNSTDPASLGMLTNQTGTNTEFSRIISFYAICADPANLSSTFVQGTCSCSVSPYTKVIGLRAKADVKWKRKSKTKTLTVYTDIYDWR